MEPNRIDLLAALVYAQCFAIAQTRVDKLETIGVVRKVADDLFQEALRHGKRNDDGALIYTGNVKDS